MALVQRLPDNSRLSMMRHPPPLSSHLLFPKKVCSMLVHLALPFMAQRRPSHISPYHVASFMFIFIPAASSDEGWLLDI